MYFLLKEFSVLMIQFDRIEFIHNSWCPLQKLYFDLFYFFVSFVPSPPIERLKKRAFSLL